MSSSEENNYEVAIVGISARYPKSPNVAAFWDNIEHGRDCITREPEKNKEPYVAAYGKIDNIKEFDADFFGMNQREAAIADPQQRFLLEGVYEALEDAGYNSLRYSGKIGLYSSCDEHIYVWNCIQQEQGSWYQNYELSKIYADGTFNTQIAYKLNLQGPAVLLKYACASSLTAVHYAYQGLLNYECDMAIAGGVSIEPEQEGYYCYDATLSRSGYTRTFDANADGFVPGAGQGVIVLKRLEEAIEDHDHIYAVIKGTNVNNDGNRKAGLPAPSVQGQEEAILDVLDLAGVSADDVDYFETHGTATVLGDSVELRALKNVFDGRASKDKVYIGSVKTNIGHTNVASGIANVIKVALMMQHNKLVPSLYYETPNDELTEADCPLEVIQTSGPWPREKRAVAGVSAFGLGGANAIAVLAQAPEIKRKEEIKKSHVFVLSGKTQKALEENAVNLAKYLENNEISLEDAAYTLQVGRGEFKYRKSFVADCRESLRVALKKPMAVKGQDGRKKIVFVFSGSGSQGETIGKECYLSFPVFKEAVDQCFHYAGKILGEDLHEDFLQYEEKKAEFEQNPKKGMILTFTIGYALAKLWESIGVIPDVILGHSLGEYIGASIAGIFTIEEAMTVIAKRAELFDKLPEGTMLNVALSKEEIEPLLPKGVSIGAENDKKRVMLTGLKEDVEQIYPVLKEKKILYSKLGVNRAGHCDSVNMIRDEFKEVLSKVKFAPANIPIVSSYLAKYTDNSEMETADYWLEQMSHPVAFYDSVQMLAKEDNVCFLEIGSSSQMTMLIRKSIKGNSSKIAVSSLAETKTDDAREGFLTAVGKLWEAGLQIKWEACYENLPYRISLPTYAFQRKSYWRYKKIFRNEENFEIKTDNETESSIEQEINPKQDCRNAMDQTIISIFKEVLGLEQISIYENLYELGFDSLSTVLITSKIERSIGEKITMNEIYSVTTILEISDLLTAKVEAKKKTKDVNDLFEDL